MNRSFSRFSRNLFVFVAAALSASAQTAQFYGQVTDPQQAAVRGAQVRFGEPVHRCRS